MVRSLSSGPALGLVVTAALLAAAVLAAPGRAPAAVITVGTFDQFHGSLCTLTDAILSANQDGDLGSCVGVGPYGADTIVLARGTYALTQPHLGGDDGLPAVTDDLTIEGNGATIARTLGTAPPFFRVLHALGAPLVLRNLAITGGRVRGSPARGGGILYEGFLASASVPAGRPEGISPSVFDLVIALVLLLDNHAEALPGGSADGGSLYASSASVSIRDSIIQTSWATADNPEKAGGACGGGLALIDVLRARIVSTLIRNNRSQARPGGFAAGAGACIVHNDFTEDPPDIRFVGSVVADNVADSGVGEGPGPGGAGQSLGAGIYGRGPHVPVLAIDWSSVTGNRALATSLAGAGGQALGGGVGLDYFLAVCGTPSVRGSTIADNSALADGGTGQGHAAGGGIAVRLPADAAMTLTDSQVTGNLARASGANGAATGGGIEYLPQGAGSLTVTSTTLGNNRAEASGANATALGGGARIAGPGTLELNGVTVSGNTATGTFSGAGGGVFAQNNGVLGSRNSILTGNTASASGPDCSHGSVSGTVTSLGNNLVGAGNSACTFAAAGDKVGVPANLGPFTARARAGSGHFPLQDGSQALDAADPATCPERDQLGQKRAGPCDMGAAEKVAPTTVFFSTLPISRTADIGETVGWFVSAINAGPGEAFQVGIDAIAPLSTTTGVVNPVPAITRYQTTNPADNLPTGTPNTPADILPGQVQTYVMTLTPTAAFGPDELALDVGGPNTLPVATIPGVNTVLVSAAHPKPADIVALVAAPGGIVTLAAVAAARPAAEATLAGVFAVATINLGASGPITVTADTGSASLPLALFLCQTDPVTSQCLGTPEPSVTVDIATNATPTFGVFPSTSATIPFDPAVNRIFVRFRDAGGAVRGGTSVAVRTL